MRVQAEVSLYPLRTTDLSEPIEAFCGLLKRRGLEINMGSMSTRISGDHRKVFAAIEGAFAEVAQRHEVAMTLKISNACPDRGN